MRGSGYQRSNTSLDLCVSSSRLPITGAEIRVGVSVAYHGGGWTFGDSVDVPDGDVEYLVSQGVIVVGLQYRLAPQ